MTDEEEDPLERIVADKDAVDRERLAGAIEGIVNVDNDSGEVIVRPGYHNLDNKPKFVARLLARRAAFELDFIDESEVGASSGEFAARMDPSDSTIQNYGSLDFVDNDEEHGGYYIPGHSIELAIDYLDQAKDDSDE
ncbi:hypothetical protein JZX76_18365 [Haloarcula hispanica]|uniref:Uncharacterized protein n=2 Tax=Haloarcula TaxID=2237 RepID=A0A847U5B8_9EURY|nr:MULTISPECIES: hypothetical protein [Haloarcula]MCJ0621390.1 hypothetical protein [Haloarcula hispanica]NLV08189.1 hypothetical protein [Haloarcula rubripromontorii]RYJ07705.1 hypothetical protein ELS20_18275 [Haloarcula hispanica]